MLALCAEKMARDQNVRSSSAEMDLGLTVFYDELVEVLRADSNGEIENLVDQASKFIHSASAKRRGRESLQLGYTISQVVHGYGSLCQAVTEYLGTHSVEPISAREFNRLNLCLDIAIAEAVTEFSGAQRDSTTREEVQRLGFLAHEMRNALSNAAAAHQMIKKGIVGLGGSTNQILEDAFQRMKDIIDRSLSEVRLRGEPCVEPRRWRVVDLAGEVEATGVFEADARSIQLHIEVAPDLYIEADRHLVVSALSNLVQNAIKFTKPNGNVWIRGKAALDRILIEVEDECGGLPPGKIEELFRPYTQKGEDRTGLGLGLSISRRAVSLNDGQISAQDIPAQGCIFTIDLPRSNAMPEEQSKLSPLMY